MTKIIIIFFLCTLAIAGAYVVLHTQHAVKHRLPDVSETTAVYLPIERLEKALFSLNNKVDIRAFLKENELFATQFLGINSQMDADRLTDKLYAMICDTHMQALYQEVQRIFGDFSAIQQQLEGALVISVTIIPILRFLK